MIKFCRHKITEKLVSSFLDGSWVLFPLGIQEIRQCLNVVDISPLLWAHLYAFKTKNLIFFQKIFKNSAGKPSIHGLFSFFICFNVSLISSIDNSFSRLLVLSSESFTVFSFFKNSSNCGSEPFLVCKNRFL